MTIVTKGYGGQAIVSWSYGDLILSIIPANIGFIFNKIETINSLYKGTNKVDALFKRVISERE